MGIGRATFKGTRGSDEKVMFVCLYANGYVWHLTPAMFCPLTSCWTQLLMQRCVLQKLLKALAEIYGSKRVLWKPLWMTTPRFRPFFLLSKNVTICPGHHQNQRLGFSGPGKRVHYEQAHRLMAAAWLSVMDCILPQTHLRRNRQWFAASKWRRPE